MSACLRLPPPPKDGPTVLVATPPTFAWPHQDKALDGSQDTTPSIAQRRSSYIRRKSESPEECLVSVHSDSEGARCTNPPPREPDA